MTSMPRNIVSNVPDPQPLAKSDHCSTVLRNPYLLTNPVLFTPLRRFVP